MKNNFTEHVLGIDIGGTNTVFALVNTSGVMSYYDRCTTAEFKTSIDLLSHIKSNIEENAIQYEYSTVGIGAPNGSSVSGCIENAPNLNWPSIIPIKLEAEKIFNKNVTLTNDANAAGLGECAWGKCRGMNDIIMLTIGTGLGCSIISKGKLIEGYRGFAGEFGHITALQDGRACKCGKNGCLEQYVSANGIQKTYIEFGGQEGLSVKEIFQQCHQDEKARKAIQFTGEILGLHLANLINILNPQAVCIAGGIAESGEILSKFLYPIVEKNVLPMHKGKVDIIFSTLENQTAGVLGAAYMGFDLMIQDEFEY